jgi:hypothetical protein
LNVRTSSTIESSNQPTARWHEQDDDITMIVAQCRNTSSRGRLMDESYQSKVTELINKSEVTAVVNSYFRALDEKAFDPGRFGTIFTAEAAVTRPNGASLTGPEEISASHQRSFTRFEGSQHLLAVPDIAIDGGTATVRANLVAMHMWQGSHTDANKADNFFIAGGVIEANLTKTDGQWKISQLSNTVVWRAGGFKNMAQTS